MNQYRFRLNVLSLLVLLSAAVHAQDFQIGNFYEKPTDLSAATAGVKDINQKPAALIRFAVRDPYFEFDPNMGVLKIEQHTGEVWVFVPQGTKTINIYHPQLGVIRDYEFPKPIKGNTTYFADVIITSRTYMEALFNQQNKQQPSEPSIKREPESRRQVEQFHPQRNQGSWSHDSEKNQGSIPMNLKSVTKPDSHFYAGIGFNAVSLMGPSAHLGFRYKLFCIEGGFVYGLDKVDNATFTLQGSSTPSEAYDYSCSKAWARLGLRLKVAESFHITPMSGATFDMISGKSTLSSTSTDYFKESYPMSIHAAVRFSYEVVEHLYLHVTPQYDFSLNGDQVFTVIKEADSKLKSWGEGFGVNAGIIYEF